MGRIADRIERIKGTIGDICSRLGRDPDQISLVVVTKSVDIDAIKEVIKAGYVDLGESRVQRLKQVTVDVEGFLNKTAAGKQVRWHMIGHLQRNKAKQILPVTYMIHSVDTLRLAEEINNAAAKLTIRSKILLQVNTSGEPQKYGVAVGAATHLAEQIESLPNVELAGLMTMAPLTHNKDIVRACFARARELFIEMRGEKIVGNSFTELSMGMSSDYEVAVEEGATILRLGSAIFSR